MKNYFARLLENQKQVHHFLNTVLKIDRAQLQNRIPYNIMTAEKGVIDGLNFPTLTSNEFRDMDYQTEEQRLALRNQIVNELFTLDLLANDDEIILSHGGAKPAVTKSTRDAYIITGLPASGKSSIATQIAAEFGAYILDSDLAKRKLPEYAGFPWGASIVHAESREVIFGKDTATFESLFTRVASHEYNLVIPTIGASTDNVLEYVDLLQDLEYKVHLTLVFLPKEKATFRALKRFNDTNRYVPLSLIFDVYAENPALTYFLLKNKAADRFASFGIINTDVPLGEPPFCCDLSDQNPANLFNYQEKFLI